MKVSLPQRLKRLDEICTPYALEILATCGVVSFIIYLRLIVEPARLVDWYTHPLLDYSTITNTDPWKASQLFLYFLAVGVIYLIGWWAVKREQGWKAWALVIFWMIAFGGAFLLQYPYGASDIFENILRGRIQGVYAMNPFFYAGEEVPNDPFFPYTFWRTQPAVYGPLWEMIAGLVVHLTGDGIIANVIGFKLISGMFMGGSVWMVALILKKMAPERTLPGVLLLAWNPMMLYETFGNGHNDLAMVFWILVAVLALVHRRYTGMILALVAGILVKYIPALLLPAAGLIVLRDLPGWGKRIRFILSVAIGSVALAALAYLPYWDGWTTIGMTRLTGMMSNSLPNMFYRLLEPVMGWKKSAFVVTTSATGMTVLFAFVRGWLARKDRSWLSLPQAAFDILAFYILVGCTWLQVWYVAWLFPFAVLFPDGERLWLGLIFSFSALFKPLVMRPVFTWKNRTPDRFFRELRLMIGFWGFPAIYAAVAMLHQARMKRLKKKESPPEQSRN